jgi:hypothetical protein
MQFYFKTFMTKVEEKISSPMFLISFSDISFLLLRKKNIWTRKISENASQNFYPRANMKFLGKRIFQSEHALTSNKNSTC